MAAPSTGVAGAAGTAQQTTANLIAVGRSDGRQWTTEEIKARFAEDRTSRQVGEPVPQDPSQVADADARKALELWRVVAARGVVEELRWPREPQYQLAFPEGFCLRECTSLAAGWSRPPGNKHVRALRVPRVAKLTSALMKGLSESLAYLATWRAVQTSLCTTSPATSSHT